MREINFNETINYNFNTANASTPIRPQNDVNQLLSDLFKGLANMFEGLSGNQFDTNNANYPSCGCTSPPRFDDGSHPSGSLKADSNKVTTPGGYEIEPLGIHEWKITGPDGKSTRIWGDPHVEEGDGGKWDFKRDSTFMLPDGTRINVSTAPYGNGATVTSGLEIINGNDRVTVSGIEQGKGNIGQVTQDGFAHANSFGNKDVFVMGKQSDDWSFQGREVTGSNNGGDSFKLGNSLPPGVSNGTRPTQRDSIMEFVRKLIGGFSNSNRNYDRGFNPYDGSRSNDVFSNRKYSRSRHRNRMTESFRALSDMFNALSRLSEMNDRMSANRRSRVFV